LDTYKVHDVTKIAARQGAGGLQAHSECSIVYKIFAYMMLARMEPALDIHQPEEQHGFRKGHRIEEHLLTANLVVDKLLAVNTPTWIISLDFSKAFDRVRWDKLWVAYWLHCRRMASLTTWCGQCKTFTLGSWGKYKVTLVILVFFPSRLA